VCCTSRLNRSSLKVLYFHPCTLLLFCFFASSAAGAQLVRINLSEQTDMMDLLGADLPVAGGAPGEFAW
jgi:hypothetical protein